MAAVWDSCYNGRDGGLPFAKGNMNVYFLLHSCVQSDTCKDLV